MDELTFQDLKDKDGRIRRAFGVPTARNLGIPKKSVGNYMGNHQAKNGATKEDRQNLKVKPISVDSLQTNQVKKKPKTKLSLTMMK